MKQIKKAAEAALIVVEEVVPALLLAFTVVAVTADVVMRYGFNRPIRGVAELCMVAFIWLVYLGSAGAARRGLHISIDFVYSRLPVRGQAILDGVINAITAGILCLVLDAGLDWLGRARFSPLPVTGWSKSILTFIVVTAALLMLLHVVTRTVLALQGAVKGEYERHSSPLTPDEDYSVGPVVPKGRDAC